MSDQPALHAERSLLGALLIRGRLDAVPPELKPEDFSAEPTRLLYEIMLRMEADEELIDLVTVSEQLESDANLRGRCGGYSYLSSLLDRVPNPDEEGIRAYARCIRAAALKRRMRAWGI